jgi:hypothetical protein
MANEKHGIMERMFGASAPATGADPPSGGADPGAGDLAKIGAQARAARAGRGKSSKAEQAIVDADKQAALDQLFEDENWEVLASMYFDVRFAMTGFEYFKLTEKQQRVLGKSMGSCMRLLLKIDPQWVALIIFSANFGAYAADKELAYRAAVKDEARRAAERNGVKH